jgi:phosphoglycerate dehydrogenase-like enzyme
MSKMRILVAIYSSFPGWTIPEQSVDALRRRFPQHEFLHAANEDEAVALIPEAEVAFASELRPRHLAVARQLRWIHSPAVGVGGMLFPEMVAGPVVMTNARGVAAETIAEHVVACVLALFRKLPLAIRSQAAREWAQDAIAAAPPVRMLAGSHVVTVGLGAIGKAVARKMLALGTTVSAVRRNVSGHCPEGVRVHPVSALRAVLATADVVVISAPQTRDTVRLIGRDELRAMRRDGVLVNVARGAIVDEDALAAALADGTIRGAALDVFEQEPLPPDSPLWTHPNVLITPHTSWIRTDHWDAMTELFAENLRRFESGSPLKNAVDKVAGY